MRPVALFFLLVGLTISGCTSSQFQGEYIPYPTTTPFDHNEFARRAFLDGFRNGYRAQLHKEASPVDLLTGPYLQARQMGFYAGAAQARRELEKGQE